jgi:hypothetical protein
MTLYPKTLNLLTHRYELGLRQLMAWRSGMKNEETQMDGGA